MEKYIKTEWLDQEVERPRTYDLIQNDDDSTTLIESFGQVTQEGTPVNRVNMMKIENELERLSEMDFSTSQPFTINEASKDESGNPDFVSTDGTTINFNGGITYTTASGEVKKYDSVASIPLSDGQVVINDGIASVVPAVYVQEDEPVNTWQTPNMPNNGDWGISDFAVRASSSIEPSDTQPSQAFDKDFTGTTGWHSSAGSYADVDMFFKNGIMLKRIEITNRNIGSPNIHPIISGKVQYSNDGVTWTDYKSFTNSNTAQNASWSIDIDSTEFKKYYRLVCNASSSNYVAVRYIRLEGEEPILGNSIWYNPKTGIAQIMTETGWQVYNGVAPAQIVDGVVHNYQYNTWLDLDTRVAVYTQRTKDEVVGWGMPDYDRGIDYAGGVWILAEFDLFFTGGALSGSNITSSLQVADTALGGNPKVVAHKYGFACVLNAFCPKGKYFKCLAPNYRNTTYYPLKGVE